LVVFNAACPGETSGSFLDTSQPDEGCQAFRAQHPLHVSYTGSQMSYAESFLSSQPAEFITLNLGANDLFRLQGECALDPATELACIEAGLPAVLTHFGENVGTIYTNILLTGFRGPLIALTTYSTNYNDPLVTGAIRELDTVLKDVTAQFGFTIADGFEAFKEASERANGDPCAAGLLIELPNGTCDVHPSKRGRDILAEAVLRVLKHHTQADDEQSCANEGDDPEPRPR
jgi:lysophospholipase L1-like esterase